MERNTIQELITVLNSITWHDNNAKEIDWDIKTDQMLSCQNKYEVSICYCSISQINKKFRDRIKKLRRNKESKVSFIFEEGVGADAIYHYFADYPLPRGKRGFENVCKREAIESHDKPFSCEEIKQELEKIFGNVS